MPNQSFINAMQLKEQKVPPIWFMRQAGRYHQHYQNLKKKYTFEQLCKTPELASEVALGPVKEFDFDLAILFSDILFILEALGMELKFDPGPIFQQELSIDNYKNYQDIEKAVHFLKFQKNALEITKNNLPKNKSIIGFVGGPWTILNYAMGKNKKIILKNNEFPSIFLEETLIPLLKKNIELQIAGGAELVMILDSRLENISDENFEKYLSHFLSDLSKSNLKKTAYYARGLSNKMYDKLTNLQFSGFGCDSSINLESLLKNNNNKFFQGNFDETKMLLDKHDLKIEINNYCNKFLELTTKERSGWICGLGHGINKATSEENVHLFIEMVRKHFV